MFALKKNGWEKKVRSKNIYMAVYSMVVLPVVLKMIKVVMKYKNDPNYFLVHITSLVVNNSTVQVHTPKTKKIVCRRNF